MSSSSISPQPASAARPVSRIAVFTHGRPDTVADALERAGACARAAGVDVVSTVEEDVDLVVALGGDGTMLRALRATLGRDTPVFGIKFGRVGFLTSAESADLETALERALGGDVRLTELATLTASLTESHLAVNDVVVTSSAPGRMVELAWEVGGEALGSQPCDGIICATPTGSTAYNLSNGGPVMMWGLEAMAITFVAPHSLHARPLVVPRGPAVSITNRTADVPLTVLVDGHEVGALAPAGTIDVGIGEATCLLAHLPEVTFFTRYHAVFP